MLSTAQRIEPFELARSSNKVDMTMQNVAAAMDSMTKLSFMFLVPTVLCRAAELADLICRLHLAVLEESIIVDEHKPVGSDFGWNFCCHRKSVSHDRDRLFHPEQFRAV